MRRTACGLLAAVAAALALAAPAVGDEPWWHRSAGARPSEGQAQASPARQARRSSQGFAPEP